MKNKLYLYNNEEKKYLHERLEQVITATEGMQAVIMIDDNKLTSLYQGICKNCLLDRLTETITEYAKQYPELMPESED